MTRDASRAAVYSAEHLVFAETLFSEPIGPAGVLDLARLVAGCDWWRRNGVPFTVVPTRRESQHSSANTKPAGRGSAQIRLSVHQEDAATLAHELAHLLASRHGADAAHGPRFVAAELDVVAVVCGTIVADRLGGAFADAGLVAAERAWPAPEVHGERGLYGRWRAARFSVGDEGLEPPTSAM